MGFAVNCNMVIQPAINIPYNMLHPTHHSSHPTVVLLWALVGFTKAPFEAAVASWRAPHTVLYCISRRHIVRVVRGAMVSNLLFKACLVTTASHVYS